MKDIAINGILLHEVQMLMVPYQKGTASYLRYPSSRIDVQTHGNEIRVSIPPMLAIEMYREGILPQNKNKSLPVSIDGKECGTYLISDFRYPDNSSHNDVIPVVLKQVESS